MTYVEFIEDCRGNVVDIETYCVYCAPNKDNAWPAFGGLRVCVACGAAT